MKIPKGMTESEVLDAINMVANGLAHKYKFGYHSLEDMKQQARLEAIEALDKFDTTKKVKLSTFLWTCVNNSLFNMKRDKFERPDKPCSKCPLNAYDPHCQASYNECTEYNDKLNCEPYASWHKRNSTKKNIMSPIGMVNVRDEHERRMKQEDNIAEDIDFSNMVSLLDAKIPVSLRKSWIKMKTDIKIPKAERVKLLDAIREILAEESYGT